MKLNAQKNLKGFDKKLLELSNKHAKVNASKFPHKICPVSRTWFFLNCEFSLRVTSSILFSCKRAKKSFKTLFTASDYIKRLKWYVNLKSVLCPVSFRGNAHIYYILGLGNISLRKHPSIPPYPHIYIYEYMYSRWQ